MPTPAAQPPAEQPKPAILDRRADIKAFLAENAAKAETPPEPKPETPAPVADAAPKPPAPAPEVPRTIDRERLDLDLERKRFKKDQSDALAKAKFADEIRLKAATDPVAALEALGVPLTPDVYKRFTYKIAPGSNPETVTPEQKAIQEANARLAKIEEDRAAEKKTSEEVSRQRDRYAKYIETTKAVEADAKYREVADLGDQALWAAVDTAEEHFTKSKAEGDPRMLSMSEALEIIAPDAKKTWQQLSGTATFKALAAEVLKAAGWTPPASAAPAAQPKPASANTPETIDPQTAATRPPGSDQDQYVLDHPHEHTRRQRNEAAMRLAGRK